MYVEVRTAGPSVAREYGFPSWRALKADVDRRRAPTLASFFAACKTGDVATLRDLLAIEPSLVRERDAEGAATHLRDHNCRRRKCSAWSVPMPSEAQSEVSSHIGPLARENAIGHGVARRAVAPRRVMTEHAVLLCAQPFDRPL